MGKCSASGRDAAWTLTVRWTVKLGLLLPVFLAGMRPSEAFLCLAAGCFAALLCGTLAGNPDADTAKSSESMLSGDVRICVNFFLEVLGLLYFFVDGAVFLYLAALAAQQFLCPAVSVRLLVVPAAVAALCLALPQRRMQGGFWRTAGGAAMVLLWGTMLLVLSGTPLQGGNVSAAEADRAGMLAVPAVRAGVLTAGTGMASGSIAAGVYDVFACLDLFLMPFFAGIAREGWKAERACGHTRKAAGTAGDCNPAESADNAGNYDPAGSTDNAGDYDPAGSADPAEKHWLRRGVCTAGNRGSVRSAVLRSVLTVGVLWAAGASLWKTGMPQDLFFSVHTLTGLTQNPSLSGWAASMLAVFFLFGLIAAAGTSFLMMRGFSLVLWERCQSYLCLMRMRGASGGMQQGERAAAVGGVFREESRWNAGGVSSEDNRRFIPWVVCVVLACFAASGFLDEICALGYYRAVNLYLITPVLFLLTAAAAAGRMQGRSEQVKRHGA